MEYLKEIRELELREAFFDKVRGKREPDAMLQEKADCRMVREDHNAPSNLPQVGYQVEFDPNADMEYLGTDRGRYYKSRGPYARNAQNVKKSR